MRSPIRTNWQSALAERPHGAGRQHQQHDPQGGGADRVHQHLHPSQPGRRDHHRLTAAWVKAQPAAVYEGGDRIEVEIEHIGHLSNVIVEAPAVGLAAAH